MSLKRRYKSLLFLVYVLISLSPQLFAQLGGGGQGSVSLQFCGTHPHFGGLAQGNAIYDRFGNAYSQDELERSAANASAHCASGVFRLNFIGAFPHDEEETICQVFADVSALIAPNSTAQIPIDIQQEPSTYPSAAAASHFFLGQCGRAYSSIVEILRTNVYPLPPTVSAGVVHIALRPYTDPNNPANNLLWHSLADGPTPGNRALDLYSVVLHEVGHMLGFGSRIGSDGNSLDGFGYSDWDRHLFSANANEWLLRPSANGACCGSKAFNKQAFPTMPGSLHGDCGLNLFFSDNNGGMPTNLAEVNDVARFAPTQSMELANKLSHLDRTCNNDKPYAMHPGILAGEVRRAFHADELQILCRLGYTALGSCTDCFVVANNDEPPPVTAGTSVLIPVLANDAAPAGALPVRISDCGDLPAGVSVVQQGNGFLVTVPANTPRGNYCFCYRLSACNGETCDEAKVCFPIISNIIPTQCQRPDCDLVCFGTFEDFVNGASTYYPQLGIVAPIIVVPGAAPDNSVEVAANATGGNNKRFVRWVRMNNGSWENVRIPLSSPIMPGCTATIKFRAAAGRFGMSVTRPTIQVYGMGAAPCAFINEPTPPSPPTAPAQPFNLCGNNGNPVRAIWMHTVSNILDLAYSVPDPPSSYTFANVDFTEVSFTWINNATNNLPITELLFYGKPEDGFPGNAEYFLDDVSVVSSCQVQVAVTPSIVTQCLGQPAVVNYQVCLTGSGSTPVAITLQANLPTNLPGLAVVPGGGFNANGTATLTLTPGTSCTPGSPNVTNLTLTLNTPNTTADIPIGMAVGAAGVCVNTTGGSGTDVVLQLQNCEPPSSTGCECPPGPNSYTVGTTGGTTSLRMTTLPNRITGGCLVVRGRLVVDRSQGFVVENSTILMDEGAEFEVPPTGVLRLLNNIAIRGCGRMWRGIRAQNGWLDVQGNALISDAEYAVNLAGNLAHPNTNINGNTFNRNYVGVYLPPLTPIRTYALSNPVQNNRFLCDGPLAPPYNGQSVETRDWALAGAFINDLLGGVSFTGINGGTVFDGPRNGILAERSTVIVTNCIFRNLRELSVGAVAPIARVYNECVDVRNGRATVNRNTMEQCRVCIRAERSALTAERNVITTRTYLSDVIPFPEPVRGIFSINSNEQRLSVRNNTISTHGDGITVGNAAPANPFFVLSNNITMMGSVNTNGFNINNCRLGGISRNTVTRTVFPGSVHTTGISSINTRECDFFDNQLFNGVTGLLTRNGMNNYFVGNQAGPGQGGTSQTPTRAFDAENSVGYYCQNKADRGLYGFHFRGQCTASDWFTCSEMIQGTGLYLWRGFLGTSTVNSFIGTQDHTGNMWLQGSTAYHAANSSSDIAQSRLTMRYSLIPPWNTAIGGPPNVDWIRPGLGQEDCSLCFGRRYTEPPTILPDTPPASPVAATAPELAIATGESTGNAATDWIARQHLYERLRRGGHEETPVFAGFLAQQENGSVGKLYRLREKMEGGGPEWAYWRSILGAAQLKLASVSEELEALREAGNDPVAITLKAADLAWYCAWVQQLEAQRMTALEASLPNLIAENAAIVAPNVLAENEKTLNQLLLQHQMWKGGVPNEMALDQLKSIADQCPFIGGLAVYRARGWYQSFVPTAAWEEDAGCAFGSGWAAPQYKVQGLSIAPNPANERLTVALPLPTEIPLHFEMTDLSGTKVLTALLSAGDQTLDLDITALPTGMYFYALAGQGYAPQTGKLAIVR